MRAMHLNVPLLVGTALCCAAAQGQLTTEEILRLPPDQRMAVVRAGIAERAERLANLDVHVTVEKKAARLQGEEIVERHRTVFRRDFWQKRLDGSYKETCVDADLQKGKEKYRWEAHFDAPSGVTRSFTRMEESGEIYGRIAFEQQSAREFNLLSYFLPGDVTENSSSYVEQVVSWGRRVEDEPGPDGELIVCTGEASDARSAVVERVWLRPDHGFSVVRFQHESELASNGENRPYKFAEGRVEEEMEVDGVWLPRRITFAIKSFRTGTGSEDVVTVHSASLGTVKPKDLEVVFPPGTELNDQTQQKAYIVGKEDLSTVSYAGLESYTPPRTLLKRAEEARRAARRPWYYWANVAAVLVLGAAALFAWRRIRAGPSAQTPKT